MTTSERTRFKGGLLEDDRHLSMPHFEARWDHILRPPFKTQMWGATTIVWEPTWALMSSMITWTASLPPKQDCTCVVLDESFAVIVGWSMDSTITDNPLTPVGWYGVREAWDWLERSDLVDQLDCAVWEATAMRSAT